MKNTRDSRYQLVIVKLGELSLSTSDIETVLNETIAMIAATLKIDCCEILELVPDGTSLLLRAGSDWQETLPVDIVMEAENESMEVYTLQHREPVIVADWALETRFRTLASRSKHMVASSISIVIHNLSIPYGLLQVHTTRQRRFTQQEVYFLQSAGNILSQMLHRKELEEGLRVSEEKYRALFEESKDVVFFATAEGELIDINSAGIHLFGFASKEEILEINIERDLYVDSFERKKYHRMLCETGHVKDFELLIETKSGDRLVIQESSTAVHDQQGNVIAYRGLMRDVTHLRQLQQKLLQADKKDGARPNVDGIIHDFDSTGQS